MLPLLMISTTLAGQQEGPRSGDYFWGVGIASGASSVVCGVGAAAGWATLVGGIDQPSDGVTLGLSVAAGTILCPTLVGSLMTGHGSWNLLGDSARGLGWGSLTGASFLGGAMLFWVVGVENLAIVSLVLAPVSIPVVQGYVIGSRGWQRDQEAWSVSLLPSAESPGLRLTRSF